jgi:hypothetical protein
MASLLDTLEEPITHEALIEMGFRQCLNSTSLDARYNLAKMTDEEKIKMVNENIYYTKFLVGNNRQFNIYYYPDTFCLERTVVRHVSAEGFEMSIRDTFGYDGVISYREPYNVEVEQVGIGVGSIYSNKFNFGFPTQQYVKDKLDLRDFIFSVKLSSKTTSYDIDFDSLASQYKTHC